MDDETVVGMQMSLFAWADRQVVIEESRTTAIIFDCVDRFEWQKGLAIAHRMLREDAGIAPAGPAVLVDLSKHRVKA